MCMPGIVLDVWAGSRIVNSARASACQHFGRALNNCAHMKRFSKCDMRVDFIIFRGTPVLVALLTGLHRFHSMVSLNNTWSWEKERVRKIVSIVIQCSNRSGLRNGCYSLSMILCVGTMKYVRSSPESISDDVLNNKIVFIVVCVHFDVSMFIQSIFRLIKKQKNKKRTPNSVDYIRPQMDGWYGNFVQTPNKLAM